MSDTKFQDTYIKYRYQITRYLAGIMKNTEDAEDLTQDCFIRLMNVSSDIAEDKLFCYLRTTAKNLAIDTFRKRRRAKKKSIKVEKILFYYETSELEVQQNVEEIVSIVKNKEHRQILELRLLHGYNIKETAKLVDKSEGLIRIYLFRAMKQIRDEMIS
ncbi:RNA polymerase sigma factor [Paenibacillus algorifonticola]|nr:RNA polymerase sigma factor [Paenibacillus algorifonticola]